MKRIIIIEDHPIVVFNLKLGLNSQNDMEVVKTFNSGKALFASSILNNIDIALLDINLPDINGFQICQFLSKNYPHIKIIGISSFEDYEHISRLLENGAVGYIVKGAKNSEMIEAINAVFAGQKYLCKIAQSAITQNSLSPAKTIKFTKREKRLMELASENPCFDFISESLGEDKDTIEVHFKLLQQKINFYKLNIGLPVLDN